MISKNISKQALRVVSAKHPDRGREQHPEMKSMGTTMTMVYIVWPRAYVVHVGDSRCYLLRKGQLEQVTTDHTMATILAESGKMSRDEARQSPMGHALWNAIGGRNDELSVDVYRAVA